MKTGTIVTVKKTGHEWNNRPVLVTEVSGGFGTVELLEQQSLPSGQRLIAYLHESYFELMTEDQQEQIAHTMGLRLEALPY